MNSILDRNIKERTKELEESHNNLLLLNKKLESSNEQLQIHDRMQKEFITLQLMSFEHQYNQYLVFQKLLKIKSKTIEQKDLLDIVIKNANRLKRLTEDILDVTRIEGNKLLLKKESVYIWELLHSIIKEFEHSLENNNNKNIKFESIF